MSKVKKWYIGVYGGEAQARPCSPAEFEIIRDRDRRYFVTEDDFDRVTAERNALQQRLNAADERVDVLEADVREKERLLLKCMEAFNNCVGMSSQATRSKWYEVYLKPVSGSVLVHFSKGIQRALGKPAESDDTTIEEEREDAKKVFVRTNTKQGQSVSLDDMLARYEKKP